MKHISNLFLVVDSSGAIARVQGDFDGAGYTQPRVVDMGANLPADGICKLTGNVYTCEYDSTGEVYVRFLDQFNMPVTDTMLFCRGNTIEIDAYGIQVLGLRRSGIVKISAATEAAGPRVMNSPSGLVDLVQQIYPVGLSGSTGPAGWTTIANPLHSANGYIAYNPAKQVGMSGVLQGSARRWESGNPTAANYNSLQFGFVDIQGGALIKFWPYYDRVIDVAANSGTYGVDLQSHWFPAIAWGLTAAGVTANIGTTAIRITSALSGGYKRNPLAMVTDYT